MNISRKRFVIYFILFGFVFLFITTSLLGTTGPRGFPKQPDSLLLMDTPVAWKNSVSMAIAPIKVILLGPIVLPSVNFLKEDPPPPFVGIYLVLYWSILASCAHYLIGRLKHS
jgi:hypothetical protein